MPSRQIIDEHEKSMEKTLEHLQNEFRSVRTGRATSGLVDNLMVDYYGIPTPLKQLGTVAVPEASMLVIKPFDPACLKEIEKAIKNSELSLAPVMDGKVVRLNIPPLSEERRQQIIGQVKQVGEKAKVSIRNIRRDANKALDDEEKSKTISEDERDKGKKDVDGITKKCSEKVDAAIKAKSEEIMVD